MTKGQGNPVDERSKTDYACRPAGNDCPGSRTAVCPCRLAPHRPRPVDQHACSPRSTLETKHGSAPPIAHSLQEMGKCKCAGRNLHRRTYGLVHVLLVEQQQKSETTTTSNIPIDTVGGAQSKKQVHTVRTSPPDADTAAVVDSQIRNENKQRADNLCNTEAKRKRYSRPAATATEAISPAVAAGASTGASGVSVGAASETPAVWTASVTASLTSAATNGMHSTAHCGLAGWSRCFVWFDTTLLSTGIAM